MPRMNGISADVLPAPKLVMFRLGTKLPTSMRLSAWRASSSLTENALTAWMDTLLPREPVRLGLHAKLVVARDEDAPRLVAALRDYERECLRLAQLVAPTPGEMRSWTALVMKSCEALWLSFSALGPDTPSTLIAIPRTP